MEINGVTITDSDIDYTTTALRTVFIEYGKSLGKTEEESVSFMTNIMTYASWAFRRRIRRKLNNGTPLDDLTARELDFVETLQEMEVDLGPDTSGDSAAMSEEELLNLEERSIKAYELVCDLLGEMQKNGDL